MEDRMKERDLGKGFKEGIKEKREPRRSKEKGGRSRD